MSPGQVLWIALHLGEGYCPVNMITQSRLLLITKLHTWYFIFIEKWVVLRAKMTLKLDFNLYVTFFGVFILFIEDMH